MFVKMKNGRRELLILMFVKIKNDRRRREIDVIFCRTAAQSPDSE